MGQHPGDSRGSGRSTPRGYRDLRPSEHNLMGQHRHVISKIARRSSKKSQSPSPQITLKALPNQCSGNFVPSLWDGSELNPPPERGDSEGSPTCNTSSESSRLIPEHAEEPWGKVHMETRSARRKKMWKAKNGMDYSGKQQDKQSCCGCEISTVR